MTDASKNARPDDQQDYAARVKDGLHTASDTVSQAAARATAKAESNPLALLVGGAAVGALAGALIPRSAREKALLKPVGQRLGAVAAAALVAAKDAGRAELDARGLTPDGAKQKARGLFKDIGEAARTAGSAAAESAKAEAKQSAPQEGGSASPSGATSDPTGSASRPVAAPVANDDGGFRSGM